MHHNNWSSDIKQVMTKLGLLNYYENRSVVNLTYVKGLINEHYKSVWSESIEGVSKLRTYRHFKKAFELEEYVETNLTKHERSLLCQFRTGILPLRIETGRYVGEAPEDRLCKLCTSQSVESEMHFLLQCERYDDLRRNEFKDMFNITQGMTPETRLCEIVSKYPRKLAKFLVKAYYVRTNALCTRNR